MLKVKAFQSNNHEGLAEKIEKFIKDNRISPNDITELQYSVSVGFSFLGIVFSNWHFAQLVY